MGKGGRECEGACQPIREVTQRTFTTNVMNFWEILAWLLWLPIMGTGVYLLVFAIAAKYKQPKVRTPNGNREKTGKCASIAVLVPAYREDAVIVDTARRLLGIDYPDHRWELVIIGDHLQPETVAQLRGLPLRLIELSLTNSTKAKALNAALAQLQNAFDMALVLDADNAVESHVLYNFNAAYQRGARVMQARRVAKNEDSPVAVLDAISEEVNNSIFCQGHRNWGLSSRLIGSGMAFEFSLFSEFMARNQAIGGFDKELELTLMQAGEVIEYLPDTWIYDEKVSQTAHFKRQRLRWIAAQYHYLGRFFRPAVRALLRGERLSFVDKTFQLLLIPRLVLVGSAGLGTMLTWLLAGPALQFAWGVALGIVGLAYLLATPKRFYRWSTLRALLHMPFTFLHLVWELRGVGRANRRFIHTPHHSEQGTVINDQ